MYYFQILKYLCKVNKLFLKDPWTNINEDTRNIAGWPLLVAVIDEQDTPPVFTIAPPTTTLSHTLEVGDTILR